MEHRHFYGLHVNPLARYQAMCFRMLQNMSSLPVQTPYRCEKAPAVQHPAFTIDSILTKDIVRRDDVTRARRSKSEEEGDVKRESSAGRLGSDQEDKTSGKPSSVI